MPHKLRVILGLAILGMGFFFLLQKWGLYQRVPKNYVWNAVDGFMKEHADVDDLILYEPSWLAGFAQDHGRLKIYSVVTEQEIFKKTYPPASQLWLISIFPKSSLAQRIQKGGFVIEETHPIYSVSLTRYSIPSRNVAFHFTDRLAEARVFIDYGDEKVIEAQKQGDSWVFSDNPIDWNQVSVRSESFRSLTHRCIWFHPLESGIKTISFSDVPLGRKLRIFGGMVDSALLTPPGPSVFLSVKIGEERIQMIEFKDTDISFSHSLAVEPFQEMRKPVSFEIQTENQTRRHFCFSAWSEA